MAEEADGGAAELALRGLSVQFMVPQRLEYHTHVLHQMLLRVARHGLGEDEDVVAVIQLHKQSEHGRDGAQQLGGPTAGRARPARTDEKAQLGVERQSKATQDRMYEAHQHDDILVTVQTDSKGPL